MSDRILDISERPATLKVSNSLLVLTSGQDAPLTIPLSELAVVIAAHPQITYTHAVLSGLAEANAVFVTCDARRRPVSMLLPLVAHSLQAERFAAQAAIALPVRKRIWKQIVVAKLLAQGRLLQELTGADHGLRSLAARVRSGDPQNLEAQGARAYWKRLFGEISFRRHGEDGLNACLDYGYAVLRATTARALCGAGLQPTLGIHHHNRYNPFCLADDLMEPFRPLADRVVAGLLAERGAALALDRASKEKLLAVFLGRFTAAGESRSLFDWIARSAFSLAAVILGESEKLELPEIQNAAP